MLPFSFYLELMIAGCMAIILTVTIDISEDWSTSITHTFEYRTPNLTDLLTSSNSNHISTILTWRT